MVQTYSRRKAVPILGITDVAIGKRIKAIAAQYPGFLEASMVSNRLTEETIELLKLWAEERVEFDHRVAESQAEQLEAEIEASTEISAGLAVSPFAGLAVHPPNSSALTPETIDLTDQFLASELDGERESDRTQVNNAASRTGSALSLLSQSQSERQKAIAAQALADADRDDAVYAEIYASRRAQNAQQINRVVVASGNVRS